MSLKNKILLYLLTLVFLAVPALSFTYYYNFEEGIKETVVEGDKKLAIKLISFIDHEIGDSIVTLDGIGDHASLKNLRKNDTSGVDFDIFDDLQKSAGEWDFIYILNADGTIVHKSGLGASGSIPSALEDEIKKSVNQVSSRKAYVSDSFVNPLNERSTILVVTNMTNGNNGGYIVGSINWRDLEEFMKLEEGSVKAYLVNKDGVIIGSNNLTENNKLYGQSINQLIRGGENPLDFRRLFVFESSAAGTGYGGYSGNGWSIYVIHDRDYISHVIYKYLLQTVLVIFSIASLVVFALLSGSRKYIFQPINRFIEISKMVGKGDYSHPVNVKSSDEFGQLASVFNTMTEQIKTHNLELEQKIKESTEALSLKASQLETNNQLLEKNRLANIDLIKEINVSRKEVMERNTNIEEEIKERTLQLNEEKIRLVASINSIPTGFIMTDTFLAPVLNNNVLYDILTLDGKKVGFHDFKRLILADFDFEASLKECLSKGKEIKKDEITFGKKVLSIFMSPIKTKDPTEAVIGAVVLISDITEEKVFERSKDEFFAVASHELRTPLTAIKGNTDLILTSFADRVKDKEVKEMLKDIKEGSERLIEIVNDFLEVARLEQGNISIKPENIKVKDFIDEAISLIKGVAADKGISIKFEAKGDKLPEIFADKGKLQQIITNLLGNAIKFTEKGQIKIAAEAMDGFVKISVEDTGSGIAPEKQPLLFRKFQPAGEMLTRDVTKSTGLGLYISKLIIGRMGGSIGLEESTVGKGSKFSFTIPTAK